MADKKATRKSYGEELARLGKENNKIVALDADLSVSTQSSVFAREFPDRFFEMGIAEANMIGTAAGLAFAGKIPFISSFACFLTGRYDIIRISVAYSKANVKIVGSHSGVAIGEDGTTQMGLEDINLMRGLPNFNVFHPGGDLETKAIVKYMADNEGPMYLRTTRQNLESIDEDKHPFVFGKGNILKDGHDLTIFSCGGTLANSYYAAKELENEGLSVRVVNIHTIKPIDVELITKCASETKGILTAEDHNIIGGLGSAVAEALSEHMPAKLKRIGINDRFGESGKPEDLYKFFMLDVNGIKTQIKEFAQKVLK